MTNVAVAARLSVCQTSGQINSSLYPGDCCGHNDLKYWLPRHYSLIPDSVRPTDLSKIDWGLFKGRIIFFSMKRKFFITFICLWTQTIWAETLGHLISVLELLWRPAGFNTFTALVSIQYGRLICRCPLGSDESSIDPHNTNISSIVSSRIVMSNYTQCVPSLMLS